MKIDEAKLKKGELDAVLSNLMSEQETYTKLYGFVNKELQKTIDETFKVRDQLDILLKSCKR